MCSSRDKQPLHKNHLNLLQNKRLTMHTYHWFSSKVCTSILVQGTAENYLKMLDRYTHVNNLSTPGSHLNLPNVTTTNIFSRPGISQLKIHTNVESLSWEWESGKQYLLSFLEAHASLDLALSVTHSLTHSLPHSQTLLRIHSPIQEFDSPWRSYKILQDPTRSR